MSLDEAVYAKSALDRIAESLESINDSLAIIAHVMEEGVIRVEALSE